MKTNLSFFILLIFGFLTFAQAQQTQSLSKQEAINNVVNNNIALKIADQNYQVSQADYKQSRALFLPNVSVSYTGMTTNSPLMVFGTKLNQEIVTQADFNPTLLNDPTNIENFNAKLEVQQPIINVDEFYKRKAAKIKLSAVALQKTRTQDYLSFEVEKAYMQLQLAYKTVSVLEKALNTAQINQQHAKNSFVQGYMQKADLLLVDIRVNEVMNHLTSAKSNVHNASDYLNTLMNSKDFTIIKPTDSLQVDKLYQIKQEISLDRSDIKAMETATKAYEQMLKSDKMTFMPTLNAFGQFEFNDNKVFQADANNYLIGAQLKWNVFEGAQRFSKVQRSKANLDKSKLELEQYIVNNNTEFNRAKRMHQVAIAKLDLAKLSVEQSKEALRIKSNRFKQGLEKTSDVLMAETAFSQKELNYYKTIFELNYAQAYLTFLTK